MEYQTEYNGLIPRKPEYESLFPDSGKCSGTKEQNFVLPPVHWQEVKIFNHRFIFIPAFVAKYFTRSGAVQECTTARI
jgi:hypothetical protein